MYKTHEEIEEFEDLEVFLWHQNFETGIQEVDEQHKALVILLNKLANSLTQEKITEVENTFTQLAKYADYHFKSEEKVWEKYFDKKNPLFQSHKQTHDSFLPTVIELQEKTKINLFMMLQKRFYFF